MQHAGEPAPAASDKLIARARKDMALPGHGGARETRFFLKSPRLRR